MIDSPAFLSRDMLDNSFSKHFIDVTNKLMDQNPNSRLGFFGVAEIKAHPFFRNLDWNNIMSKEMKPPFTPKVDSLKADKQCPL